MKIAIETSPFVCSASKAALFAGFRQGREWLVMPLLASEPRLCQPERTATRDRSGPGMPRYDFDMITLGAGSGGVASSRRAGSYGAKVAIIEESRVGGTCVLRGCVPKKLLVYGAQFADAFADAAGFGWNVAPPTFDWPSLIAAKNKELDRLQHIHINLLKGDGRQILQGRGDIVDPHPVEVARRRYTAEAIPHATRGPPTVTAL